LDTLCPTGAAKVIATTENKMMNTTATQQIEIRFPNVPLTPARRRARRRSQQARWWFDRMRLEVDRALLHDARGAFRSMDG